MVEDGCCCCCYCGGRRQLLPLLFEPFCFLNELHVFQESKLRVRARPVVCIPFCVDIKSFVASQLQRCQSIRFCVYEVI
jgi:hypothetical protein